ncbi:hypothetical protein DSO57_1035562 [Entomophthora muscae]|uniref:Uncharacterized protein n=1 Tax=Entomophthora muscae TaxID=34485 RepID=A0ACC2REB2_9FUNG|nr:hypothetical protein DSO57_1035562 [Entomophthora muscae]
MMQELAGYLKPVVPNQVQEQGSNPGLDYLWATRPKDQEDIHTQFLGLSPLELRPQTLLRMKMPAKNLKPRHPIKDKKLPNGVKVILTTSLMNLKPILAANQDSPPEKNADMKASPMTITQEQKSQETLPEDPANTQLPRNSAVFLLQTPGIWTPDLIFPGPMMSPT